MKIISAINRFWVLVKKATTTYVDSAYYTSEEAQEVLEKAVNVPEEDKIIIQKLNELFVLHDQLYDIVDQAFHETRTEKNINKLLDACEEIVEKFSDISIYASTRIFNAKDESGVANKMLDNAVFLEENWEKAEEVIFKHLYNSKEKIPWSVQKIVSMDFHSTFHRLLSALIKNVFIKYEEKPEPTIYPKY